MAASTLAWFSTEVPCHICDLQVRSQDLEVQFAATTAELQQLKGKQKTLEARNLLLEKLVQLSKQQQQPASDLAAQSNVSSFPDVVGQCALRQHSNSSVHVSTKPTLCSHGICSCKAVAKTLLEKTQHAPCHGMG